MSDALRKLAIARDYPELHQALRSRQAELGMSFQDLNHVSGLTYAEKLLAPDPTNRGVGGRGIGPTALGPLLGGLGLVLIVAEDIAATLRLRSRYLPRCENNVNSTTKSTLEQLVSQRVRRLLDDDAEAITARLDHIGLQNGG